MGTVISSAFDKSMLGYGLTTAHIFYHIPDYPALLQEFIWQDYDLAPRFPELKRFLDFWHTKLDGKLEAIEVAHERLIRPASFTIASGQWTLH